jgi:hypothetical protein
MKRMMVRKDCNKVSQKEEGVERGNNQIWKETWRKGND